MSRIAVNPKLKAAQYAVRGAITARAQEIQEDLAHPTTAAKYSFGEVIYCNIGNPQQLNQKPLTFNRQVMALIDAPFMLDDEVICSRLPKDAVARAKSMVASIGGPNKTGAYTHSQGYAFIRKNVADFITTRDRKNSEVADLPTADPANIFLTDGVFTGVKMIMQVILGATPTDALMIPIPQYPLYTGMLPLMSGLEAPYFLDEDAGWAMTRPDLEKAYASSTAKGHHPKGLVVINPGNPTGQVLDSKVISEVIEFAHSKNLVLIADEVYQENIYAHGKKFHSFREMLLRNPSAEVRKETSLVSLQTTSKGIIGECGRRGGFAEFTNFESDAFAQIVKIASMGLCANVNGQVMTDLMVKEPQQGDESYESYREEWNNIFASLKKRAVLLEQQLNEIPGLKCNPVEGSMYGYANLSLPNSFVDKVKQDNEANGTKLQPDFVWATQLLEETGIVVVPGSGFGQKEGTWHFRTTILPPEEQMDAMTKRMRAFQEGFNKKFQ